MTARLAPHAPGAPAAARHADDRIRMEQPAPGAGQPDAARSQLRLSGLWCAACAGVVEQALLREPGVSEARVSYATQRAEVAWDPSLTRLSSLLGAIHLAGYGAAPDIAAPAQALRRAERRSALWRLVVAIFCMMQVMMYQAPIYFAAPGTLAPDLRALLSWAAWLLSIPVVVFSAAPLFGDALKGLRGGRIGMDLPVSLGIAIMFVASSAATFDPHGLFGGDVYFDSLTMFVSFLLAGRYLALKMRHRVAAALEDAIDRLPATLRRLEADGSTSLVPPQELRVGDRLRVLPGEAFAADGPILEGITDVDEALLTGESLPRAKAVGDEAIAGSINLSGAVVQRADRIGADTRYDGIVALMRGALVDRPQMLRAADRIAGPFLWAVLVLAAGAAAAWSLVDPARAVWVAVAVLIVTCPCALSLAAPSALLAAAGALARRGVLLRRLDAIEALARIDTVCIDKTGTLTDRQPRLARTLLQPAARRAAIDEAAALALAASLGALSSHPLALALAAEAKDSADPAPPAWTDSHEHPGLGIEARLADGRRWRLGSAAWAGGGNVDTTSADAAQTWLAGPQGPIACFTFRERLRPDANAAVEALRRAQLELLVLSGDAAGRVRRIAAELGIQRYRGDATPQDKLDAVVLLQDAGHRVAMLGDGVNDAPVMARADVSVALGDGAALARTGADIVLMSGSLADFAQAREIACRALRVVRQNIVWAISYNVVCVPLALLGVFPPWAAGLGMAASSLVVVLNALRLDRSASAGRRATSTAPSLLALRPALDILFLLVPFSVLLVLALMAVFAWALFMRASSTTSSARAKESWSATPNLTRIKPRPDARFDTPAARDEGVPMEMPCPPRPDRTPQRRRRPRRPSTTTAPFACSRSPRCSGASSACAWACSSPPSSPGRAQLRHPVAQLRPPAPAAHQRRDLRLRRLRADGHQPLRRAAHLAGARCSCPSCAGFMFWGWQAVIVAAGDHAAAGLHARQGIRRARVADRRS